MGNENFILLWSKILDSSIWDEDPAIRVVWITMLACKNKDGKVISTFNGLARNANVSPEICQRALDKFLASDPATLTDAEEGRRIRKIEGGWEIINHAKYQYSSDERRQYWAKQKAEQRKREPKKKRAFPKSTPMTNETLYERAVEREDGTDNSLVDS